MIFRAAQPINVSSTDFILTRANQGIMIGTAGNLVVDMATNYPPIKSAQIVISGINSSTGAITAVTINFGGANYASAPIITLNSPYGGSGAVITTTLTDGVVTSTTISSGGTGYNNYINGTLQLPQIQISGGKGTGITLPVPAGIIPVSISKVYHSGTTAGVIVLLYESVGQGS